MAYVIAEPCIGTKDSACVDACPVDCIHPKKDEGEHDSADQLFIDPVECNRLRRLRSCLPCLGHLRPGRPAGEVGLVH